MQMNSTSVDDVNIADVTTADTVTTRRDVYRTFASFGLMFYSACAAYGTFEALQSTINVEGGLGTTAVGVMYACAILSTLFIAPTEIARLGPRWALCLAWSAQLMYAAANAFPRWETMIPALVCYGATYGATLIVFGIYSTTLAEQMAAIRAQEELTVTSATTPEYDVEDDDNRSISTALTRHRLDDGQ